MCPPVVAWQVRIMVYNFPLQGEGVGMQAKGMDMHGYPGSKRVRAQNWERVLGWQGCLTTQVGL